MVGVEARLSPPAKEERTRLSRSDFVVLGIKDLYASETSGLRLSLPFAFASLYFEERAWNSFMSASFDFFASASSFLSFSISLSEISFSFFVFVSSPSVFLRDSSEVARASSAFFLDSSEVARESSVFLSFVLSSSISFCFACASA